MNHERGNIVWNYSGKSDYLLGNGATIAEKALAWAASLLGLVLVGYLFLSHRLSWSWWQYFLAGIIAFDIIGGIVANSLNSCKRFYHSPIKPNESRLLKSPLAFSALHIYPVLIAFLFDSSGYLYGAFWYVLLLVATMIILRTPLYLQRPVAFFLITLALLLNLYVITPVQGFEWLAPALFIKLLYGHLVPEEPYRPSSEK